MLNVHFFFFITALFCFQYFASLFISRRRDPRNANNQDLFVIQKCARNRPLGVRLWADGVWILVVWAQPLDGQTRAWWWLGASPPHIGPDGPEIWLWLAEKKDGEFSFWFREEAKTRLTWKLGKDSLFKKASLLCS